MIALILQSSNPESHPPYVMTHAIVSEHVWSDLWSAKTYVSVAQAPTAGRQTDPRSVLGDTAPPPDFVAGSEHGVCCDAIRVGARLGHFRSCSCGKTAFLSFISFPRCRSSSHGCCGLRSGWRPILLTAAMAANDVGLLSACMGRLVGRYWGVLGSEGTLFTGTCGCILRGRWPPGWRWGPSLVASGSLTISHEHPIAAPPPCLAIIWVPSALCFVVVQSRLSDGPYLTAS